MIWSLAPFGALHGCGCGMDAERTAPVPRRAPAARSIRSPFLWPPPVHVLRPSREHLGLGQRTGLGARDVALPPSGATAGAATGGCDAHGGRRSPCPPRCSPQAARRICVATTQPGCSSLPRGVRGPDRVLNNPETEAERTRSPHPPPAIPHPGGPRTGSGAEQPGNRGRAHPIASAPLGPRRPRLGQNHFVGRSPGSKPSTCSKRSSRSAATCHSPAYSRLANPSSKRCSNTASNGSQKPATSSRTMGLRW
jgi:hypothetical protein